MRIKNKEMRKIIILGKDKNGKFITHVYRDKKQQKPPKTPNP